MDRMTEDRPHRRGGRRADATPDPRLREVMQALVRHLHAFAREVRLTRGVAVGHRVPDRPGRPHAARQEFILLSDTLGLSSLVDMVNHSDVDALATETTILGPFYAPESPWREYGASMVEYDDGGEPTVLRGVLTDDAGQPDPGAVIDACSNRPRALRRPAARRASRPPTDGGATAPTTRAVSRSAPSWPAPYPIPDDGPVGKLLAATGRHQWRAAHIHIKASADGYEPLTTHIFDRRSDYLDSDTVFGVKESLIEDFVPGEDGVLLCEHDIVLTRARG